MNDLPTIFTSPYASDVAPTDCCCGGAPGVVINLTPAPLVDDNGTIISRQDQAAVIIAKAQAKGYPIFQGV